MFESHAVSWTFDKRNRVSVEQMGGKFRGYRVIFARSYDQLPRALASDISDEIASLPDVGEKYASQLIVGESQRKSANLTSASWVADMLSTKGTEPIVVIVFISGKEADKSSDIHFVLMRGTTSSEGVSVIDAIAHGSLADAMQ